MKMWKVRGVMEHLLIYWPTVHTNDNLWEPNSLYVKLFWLISNMVMFNILQLLVGVWHILASKCIENSVYFKELQFWIIWYSIPSKCTVVFLNYLVCQHVANMFLVSEEHVTLLCYKSTKLYTAIRNMWYLVFIIFLGNLLWWYPCILTSRICRPNILMFIMLRGVVCFGWQYFFKKWCLGFACMMEYKHNNVQYLNVSSYMVVINIKQLV